MGKAAMKLPESNVTVLAVRRVYDGEDSWLEYRLCHWCKGAWIDPHKPENIKGIFQWWPLPKATKDRP